MTRAPDFLARAPLAGGAQGRNAGEDGTEATQPPKILGPRTALDEQSLIDVALTTTPPLMKIN